MIQRALLTFAAVGGMAAIAASQASFTNYGTSCDLPGGPPPLIRNTGLPQLGTSFTVRYIGPNGTTPVSIDWPVLITGFQQASIPVPMISALQPPGCTVQVMPDITTVMPPVGTRFQDFYTVQIPNNPNLIGFTYYQQWATMYARCSTSCTLRLLRLSDAAAIVVGV